MNKMFASRVKETTTTTGTGTYTLSGSAVAGFRTFAASFTTGQLVYYTVVFGTSWETGYGLLSIGAPSTLARTQITASSNGGAPVNWGIGTKSIFCDVNPSAFVEPETNVYVNTMLTRAAASTFLTVSGTAYCVYVGRTTRPYTAAFVECHLTDLGAGTQVAELGIFSSPLAPNRGNQTLSKLVATGTVDTLTSAQGVKRNTASFAFAIGSGTHLWAVMRVVMATTQPSFIGLAADMSQGHILVLTGASALTGIATIAGVTVSATQQTIAPDLRVTNS